MRIAYFDCSAGISGDMVLGALIDTGVSLHALQEEWHKLAIASWDVEAQKVVKHGIAATDVRFLLKESHHAPSVSAARERGDAGNTAQPDEHEHPHSRSHAELIDILQTSHLAPADLHNCLGILQRLASAEAGIHNTTCDTVHFHELGGLDTLLDIVGAVAGLRLLGVEKVYSSPLPLSCGEIRCAHGAYPVPAPAVTQLLKGAVFRHVDINEELITPTGAAILAHYNPDFLNPPEFRLHTIGWGAGKKDLAIPNVLRLLLGESCLGCGEISSSPDAYQWERVHVLEANIDDMNPQHFDMVIEQAFALGALDVTLTPVHMKKNRIGVQLSIISPLNRCRELTDLIFHQTTTLGVRVRETERVVLPRARQEVKTGFGAVRVKLAYLRGRLVNVQPEYEDCKRLAEQHGCSLQEVADASIQEARRRFLDKA